MLRPIKQCILDGMGAPEILRDALVDVMTSQCGVGDEGMAETIADALVQSLTNATNGVMRYRHPLSGDDGMRNWQYTLNRLRLPITLFGRTLVVDGEQLMLLLSLEEDVNASRSRLMELLDRFYFRAEVLSLEKRIIAREIVSYLIGYEAMTSIASLSLENILIQIRDMETTELRLPERIRHARMVMHSLRGMSDDDITKLYYALEALGIDIELHVDECRLSFNHHASVEAIRRYIQTLETPIA